MKGMYSILQQYSIQQCFLLLKTSINLGRIKSECSAVCIAHGLDIQARGKESNVSWKLGTSNIDKPFTGHMIRI